MVELFPLGWNNRTKYNLAAIFGVLVVELLLFLGSAPGNTMQTKAKIPDATAAPPVPETLAPGATRAPLMPTSEVRDDTSLRCPYGVSLFKKTTSGSVEMRLYSKINAEPVCYYFSCPSKSNVIQIWGTAKIFPKQVNNTLTFSDLVTGETFRTYDGMQSTQKVIINGQGARPDAMLLTWNPDISYKAYYGYSDYEKIALEYTCWSTPAPYSLLPFPPYSRYGTESPARAREWAQQSEEAYANYFPFDLGVYETSEGGDLPALLLDALDLFTMPGHTKTEEVTFKTPCADSSISKAWTAMKILLRATQVMGFICIAVWIWYCRNVVHEIKWMETVLEWTRLFMVLALLTVDGLLVAVYLKSVCTPGDQYVADGEKNPWEEYTLKLSFDFNWGAYCIFAAIVPLGIAIKNDGIDWATVAQVRAQQEASRPRPSQVVIRPSQTERLINERVELACLLAAISAGNPNMRFNNPKVETFTPAPVPPPTIYGPSNRKALLVGANYKGSGGELKGCIADVKRTAQKMQGSYQIKVLTDDMTDPYQRPTRQGIMNGIRWLLEGVQKDEGRTLFFLFSGHGSQVPDEDGDEEDGLDETIVPCDWESAGMITDDVMQDEFLRKVPVGNRVLALMDCCHSGTVLDLPYYALPKKEQNDNRVDMVGDNSSRNNRVDCDAIMISGCSDAQCSVAVPCIGDRFLELADAEAGGALTAAFLLVVGRDPNATLEGLLLGLRRALAERGFTQIPQISGSKPYDMKATHFDLFPNQMGDYQGPASPMGGGLLTSSSGAWQPPPPMPPAAAGPPAYPPTPLGNPYASANPYGSVSSSSNPYSGNPLSGGGGVVPPPPAPMSPQGVGGSVGAAAVNPYAAGAAGSPPPPAGGSSGRGAGYVPPPLPPAGVLAPDAPPRGDDPVKQYDEAQPAPSFGGGDMSDYPEGSI